MASGSTGELVMLVEKEAMAIGSAVWTMMGEERPSSYQTYNKRF
jgi:hypothetical protein